jgi:agmatinase
MAPIDPLRRWQEVGERPSYAGFLSWGGCPYTEELAELAGADVAIVGAPMDDLASDVPGARFGPRAIRAASVGLGTRVGSPENPVERLRVVDYGDAAVRPGDVAASHKAIRTVVAEVVGAGALPIVLGGDHSVTGPALRAVAERHGRLALIHLDAHTDTATHVYGVAPSHGSVMRELVEDGSVDPAGYVQLGLRGYWPEPDVLAWQRDRGITEITMDEIRSSGLDAALARAVEVVGDRPAYLTIDIDVVEPGAAPGTGTPEPGGLEPAHLLRAASVLAGGTRIAGADLVEVAPTSAHGDPTAVLADRAVREIVEGIAERADGILREPWP